MIDIRMLTVRQPWASLLARGIKPVENRRTRLNWRGVVLIHAGLEWSDISPPDRFSYVLPRGGIVGMGAIVDCVTKHPSPYFTGPYGWVFAGASILPFMPCRGQQGLPWAPEEIVRKIDHERYRVALQRALDVLPDVLVPYLFE